MLLKIMLLKFYYQLGFRLICSGQINNNFCKLKDAYKFYSRCFIQFINNSC